MKAIVFEKIGDPQRAQVRGGAKARGRARHSPWSRCMPPGSTSRITFSARAYVIKAKPPDTPGLEAAGVIDEVGPEVKGLRPGMRVAGIGSRLTPNTRSFTPTRLSRCPIS